MGIISRGDSSYSFLSGFFSNPLTDCALAFLALGISDTTSKNSNKRRNFKNFNFFIFYRLYHEICSKEKKNAIN